MPLLKLETTVAVPEDKQQPLLASLSKIVSETIGKPEQYVMVTLGSGSMLMSGKIGPACFGEIRSIGGLNQKVNGELSRKICRVLNEALGIPTERIYLNFIDVAAADWGWNGGTFG